ncbi:MAG: serine--tRNA ligase [Rhodospirillaceae bacterium]|nr:MAG: serine--tRNA ligase [Rhodospirillaceae bacterium]
MLDLKWIRENPGDFDAALARRGTAAMSAAVLAVDQRHRAATTELQSLQSRRNEVSKQIGGVKAKGGDAAPLMAEVATIKDRMAALEVEEKKLGEEVRGLLLTLPNILHRLVPDGRDESANVEVRRWGTPPTLNFTAKDHADLGVALGLMDFDQAAVISGARFVVLKGALARLERALAQFMLDTHTVENGYTEVAPPFLVKEESLVGTGQLPKFADDLYRTTAGAWLIPTAEVSLTNLVAGRILDGGELPMRVTAFTPCFRSEAGAAGKDTRGMIRQHQFNKVELVSIVTPEESEAEHERMTRSAEGILQRLELPYRVMALCAGDVGFGANRTYDLEVWLPGQNAYREISSCSNTGEFQARRMNARYRPAGETKGTRFVHTLNGSGLAVGRTLVAVLENYQNADGSIRIPAVLKPYMGGLDTLLAAGRS